MLPYQAIARQVSLPDGDRVVVHDDTPAAWRPGDPVALLTHGLIGSHQSPLLVRLASKLNRRGVRVFRWDMRGCGAGRGLARFPYHAGCSEDLARVIEHVIDCSLSTTTIRANQNNWPINGIDSSPSDHDRHSTPFLHLFGVSLSGNILLKYLGERSRGAPPEIASAVAVNPPVDLEFSVKALRKAMYGWYDRYFSKCLRKDLERRRADRPDAPMPVRPGQPRGVEEFDDWYTAPVSGFESAGDYYQRCSALQFLPNIVVPTTILTSSDDPMVPVEMFNAGSKLWSQEIRLAIRALS